MNPRICKAVDKALGRACLVCRKPIQVGDELISIPTNNRYRHTKCIPKTSQAQTPEQLEQEIRNAGKSSEGADNYSSDERYHGLKGDDI